MCLSFNYTYSATAAATAVAMAASAGEAALKANHNVKCNGIQLTKITHEDGSHSMMFFLPILSETAKIAMYPCPPDCLGEEAQFLVPSGTMPCNAANLEAFRNPGKYVPFPDPRPGYRSLSDDGGADGGSKAEVPVIELPPSKCIINLNGSCTFVLKTASYVKSDSEIEAAIASNQYPDKPTYLETLARACFKSLTESMDAHNVDKSKIFAMSEDDPTKVDPFAMINFLDEFYPNLRANNDMLVCIPGADKDGNLKMEAAFSFCFHYPEARHCQPMLGLVHNIDHTNTDSEQPVEEDYHVTSNTKSQMTINNTETGATTKIDLFTASEFLPYPPYPPREEYDVYDHDAWISGCAALQYKMQTAYWESMSALCLKMGLPDFNKEYFETTNLVGRSLPKNATSVMCYEDEYADRVARMKAAERASKRQTRELRRLGV
tara:strand:- start:307 stop:1611 length:1305 start_codon:yes stop_codon:yes gene_type:complete